MADTAAAVAAAAKHPANDMPDCSDEALKKKAEEKAKAKAKLLAEIQCILKEYDGQAANIPPSHGYWSMLNEYRAQ